MLPKIILGSAMFGTGIDDKTSCTLMDLYTEHGGFCIDTASVYGDWQDTGEPISELTIGRWLKQSGYRDKMKIITKGAHFKLKDPERSRVSAACIEADIQKSLKSLQVEAIDVYFIHRDNVNVPVSEIMPILHKYVEAGFIKAIGASNWSVQRILEANAFARSSNLTPLSVSQIRWSLAALSPGINPQFPNDVLPEMTPEEFGRYMTAGLPVLAWSSQASGVVSKVIAGGWDGINQQLRDSYYNEENIRRIDNVRALMKKKGISATQASLGYITCNRLAAGAVIGPSNLNQLKDSMMAADIGIDAEEIEALVR
jgi:aryl-alcohol dehydrogenase-like predicted oxidoreductase